MRNLCRHRVGSRRLRRDVGRRGARPLLRLPLSVCISRLARRRLVSTFASLSLTFSFRFFLGALPLPVRRLLRTRGIREDKGIRVERGPD